MIGFEVIAPKPVPLECRRKRQRTLSRGIVRASSLVAVAARWLAMLPFAEVQDTLTARAPQPAASRGEQQHGSESGHGSPARQAIACPSVRTSEEIAAPTEHVRKISRRERKRRGETPPALTLSSFAIEATARRRG